MLTTTRPVSSSLLHPASPGRISDPPDRDGLLPHRTAAWLIFGIALLVYTATAGGGLTSTDPVVTYDLTVSLVERGSIAIEPGHPGMKRPGVDGRLYSWFGIGQSIYNIPFYLVGRAVARGVGPRVGKPDSITKAAVGFGSAVAAAACASVVFLFGWRLTAAAGASAAAALALAFGTIMWPYARFGFNMPLAALLVVSGTYFTWVGVRRTALRAVGIGGGLLGCAFLTRHECLILVGPLGLWIVMETRRDRRRLAASLAALAVPLAAGATIWAMYNQVRFGNPFDSGQSISGTSSIEILRGPFAMDGRSFGASLSGLLFNPSTSVLLYSPLVLLSLLGAARLAASDRSTARLLVGQGGAHILFLAVLGNWSAGRAYGSRYMVLPLPLLAVPLSCWFRQLRGTRLMLTHTLLALSVLVQLPGVLVDYSKVDLELARASGAGLPTNRLESWAHSDLAANARVAIRLVPVNVRYLAGFDRPPRVEKTAAPNRHDFGQQFAFSLDFWWLYLFYLGAVPALVALCGFVIPLAAAAFLAFRLRLLCDGNAGC